MMNGTTKEPALFPERITLRAPRAIADEGQHILKREYVRVDVAEADVMLAHRLIVQARDEWIENNYDGTADEDIVTPYDEWFYKDRGAAGV